MGKYLMVIANSPQQGREDEYNDWYDNVHLPEVCANPGIVSGKRYDALENSPHRQPTPWLTIYEIEADDPNQVLAEMQRRTEAGEMQTSDARDPENTRIWMYKARD